MYEVICKLDDIILNAGVAALVGEHQVAVFRIDERGTEKLYAISNYDPFSKANVISRGIVGCLSGKTVIASPVYKHHFYLENGKCVQDESVTLKTWEVVLENGKVKVFNEEAVAA